MKVGVFTIYDKAVLAYNTPFFARHTGEAIRSFTDLCRDPQSNVSRHPEDFSLYSLGTYDDGSGVFDCTEPVRIVSANELLATLST